MKTLFFVLALITAPFSYGQTGQALIANPLLSPEKLKVVKRQIMEAGHQELVQPNLSMPIAPPSQGLGSSGGAAGNTGMGMPALVPPSEGARRVFAQLRVMAVVGATALIAAELPPPQAMPINPMNATASAYRMDMGLPMQNPQIQNPTIQNNGAQISQNSQQIRRARTTTVRNGVPAYIDGYEVTPWVHGDTVRLVLAAMPSEIVFQGSVQPALYSPPGTVQPAGLEKSNNEYLTANKPDSTSMGQQSAAAPLQTQYPAQNNPSFPNYPR